MKDKVCPKDYVGQKTYAVTAAMTRVPDKGPFGICGGPFFRDIIFFTWGFFPTLVLGGGGPVC